MPETISVNPQLLRWARERAALAPAELARRVGLKEERVQEWETTGELPLAHLERLASKTYTPVGYLFLPEPPEERLPIPDYRTPHGGLVLRPSPDLLDTIYSCQQRQDWYRELLVAEGDEPISFIASATMQEPAAEVARRLRGAFGLTRGERAEAKTWEEALTALVERIETAGVLVMRNGVVGNNTHRKLDVGEFRGLALSDPHAPLVFINAADAKGAQMFTLAHEVAHLWLGQSGVSDVDVGSAQAAERYCNAVAAEVLVPMEEFSAVWRGSSDRLDEARRLAREFKVSALVILIRAREAGAIGWEEFNDAYAAERARSFEAPTSTGGNFYNTQGSRLGKRFARAVIASALEGRTTYKEAFQLLGLKRASSFDELAHKVGVTG